MVSGNHEHRIRKESSIDITEVIASHLGVYYAGDEAFLKLKFGKNEKGDPVVYTIYMTHGWGAGRTPGSKVPDVRSGNINEMKRTFASSGAFLDRGGYGVQKGYPAAKLGSPRLRLDGRRRDVHVSI